MAKPRTTIATDENAVAAHTSISEAADKLGKHADTLLRRIEHLQGQVAELQTELSSEQEQHNATRTKADDRYNRDTAELKGKLAAAEDKLRRVLVTLS